MYKVSALIPAYQSMEHVSSLLAVKFLPIEDTKMLVLTDRTSVSFSSMILNILSIPIEPPTDGMLLPENIPIRPSYLPPPEIEPTLFVSVNTASYMTPV